MKNAFKAALPAICMIAGAAAHAQNVVSIKGQLAVNRQGMVRINYTSGSLYVEDSAQVKNGAFVLKGTVGDPVKAMLSFYAAGTNRNQQVTSNAEWKELYLEKGAVWIESNAGLKEAVIKGGKTQNDYAGWAAQHKVLDDQLSRIGARAMEYKMSMNDTGMQGIRNRSMPLVQQKKKIDSVFIKTHPDSYLSFVLLFRRSDGIIEPEIIEPAFNRLSANVRNSIAGKKLAARIAKAKTLAAGQPAPGFTWQDTSGKVVSLASLKGKYVLLHFWSTQSYNVNSELFSINRIQKQFAGKNLTVLSVAFGNETERWKKTLSDNAVHFTCVLDSGNLDKQGNGISKFAADYDLNFYSLQQCILINPDGKIIARPLAADNQLTGRITKFIGPPAESHSQTAAANEPLDMFIGGQIAEYPKVDWIKGDPITHFDKDKIYIVELWATWCGPCVAAMPHLNELHKKYKDKGVVFVAQGVWEEDKKKLVDFVKQKGEGLSYRVAFSGTKGSEFDKRWVVPASVNGIPATFVIQDGKLVWQTTPDHLNETIIQMLIDKKFTIEAAQATAATH